MKHFQDLGHRVIYVVGAFTALIGDPTGRSKTRPPLTQSEIDRNAETYKTQIFKLLDPAKTEVRFNSEWLEPLGSAGWVHLAAKYNVAQMLERRDFRKRYDTGQPISIHEFLYPLAQAYDSVHLVADVELGGTDQLFNLNVGRDIMPAFGLEAQVVMTTPLLEGLDGVEKMSKSLGNYIGVTDSPSEMFGKVMSISDDLMWRYYSVLTDLSARGCSWRNVRRCRRASCIREARRSSSRRPSWRTFMARTPRRPRRRSSSVGSRSVRCPTTSRSGRVLRGTTIEHLLLEVGFAQSGSDASRKVQQGAVRIDGEKFLQPRTAVDRPGSFLLQVGRQISRIVVLEPTDVLLTSVPAPDGDEIWMLMQNKGQVDVLHPSREVARRARAAVAEASKGRVFRARKRPSFRAKRVNCEARGGVHG